MCMFLCDFGRYSFAFNICPRVLSVGFLFVSLFFLDGELMFSVALSAGIFCGLG